MDRRALRPVEQPGLHPGGVGNAPHQPAQRIDLSNQMALTNATNRRVARQHTGVACVECNQRRARAEARRRRSRFAAGVTGTDDDDIERIHGKSLSHPAPMFHVELFADAKAAENLAEYVFDANAPSDASQC